MAQRAREKTGALIGWHGGLPEGALIGWHGENARRRGR